MSEGTEGRCDEGKSGVFVSGSAGSEGIEGGVKVVGEVELGRVVGEGEDRLEVSCHNPADFLRRAN